jgi:hypothetical protein
VNDVLAHDPLVAEPAQHHSEPVVVAEQATHANPSPPPPNPQSEGPSEVATTHTSHRTRPRSAPPPRETATPHLRQAVRGGVSTDFVALRHAVRDYDISRSTIYRLVRKGELVLYGRVGDRRSYLGRRQLEELRMLRPK